MTIEISIFLCPVFLAEVKVVGVGSEKLTLLQGCPGTPGQNGFPGTKGEIGATGSKGKDYFSLSSCF